MTGISRVATALAVLLVLAGCGGDEQRSSNTSSAGADPEVEVIATGLEVPWDIAFLPDDRALVTERPGRVRLVSADGALKDAPVAEIPVDASGEGGLLGAALDPGFEDGNPFVYFMATQADGVRVLRYRWADDSLTADGVALEGVRTASFHTSGRIRFGPDDRLYVVTGDAGDPESAQDPATLNGKVLSLEPSQYREGGGQPRIVSVGHRNPQGLDWQPGSDRLFVAEHGPSGDVGPSCCDEVNVVTQGGNALWPQYGDEQEGKGAPEQLWQDTIAPSGAAFVTRSGSAWTGDLLVAALLGTSLRRLDIDGSTIGDEEVLLDGDYGRLRAVVEAPDGSIWVTTSNRDGRGSPEDADDRILRIVPPAG
jgi:glucose/arabinose dehydrogenase